MTTSRSGRPIRPFPYRFASRLRHGVAGRVTVSSAALVVLVSTIVTLGAVTSAAAAQVTINASADSYIQSDQPDSNFGTTTQLTVRAGSDKPTAIAYVKFVVSGLSGAPAGVQLRLYSYAQSATGVQVYTAASTWTETGLTWNTAPVPGATLVANMSGLLVNAYATTDVSSVVTGNGTYTFVISTTSTLGKQLASREVAADPPQLLINTAGSTAVAAVSGGGQSTAAGTAFAAPLVAKVTDGTGAAVSGVQVTFTAPTSGASAAFPGGTSAVSVATDANGLATSPVLTANATAGGYAVTATADGVAAPASFALTNGSVASPTPSPSASPPPSPTASPSASPSPTPSPSPSPSGTPTGGTTTTYTFKATADSYVRSDQPDTNFGADYVIGTEAGSASTPTLVSYLKFTVTGVTGTITGATLQVYSFATSALGWVVSGTSSGWTETGITYTNAPAIGAVIGNGPNIAVNTWASIDTQFSDGQRYLRLRAHHRTYRQQQAGRTRVDGDATDPRHHGRHRRYRRLPVTIPVDLLGLPVAFPGLTVALADGDRGADADADSVDRRDHDHAGGRRRADRHGGYPLRSPVRGQGDRGGRAAGTGRAGDLHRARQPNRPGPSRVAPRP